MTVAKLARLVSSVKSRRDSVFIRQTSITEWSTRLIATVVAGTAQDESGKFQGQVAKIGFPWAEFGFPEVAGAMSSAGSLSDAGEPGDLSYLETGDTSAAEKNAGKDITSVFPM